MAMRTRGLNISAKAGRRSGSIWIATAVTVGAGVALAAGIEIALIPGLAIGVGAALAPRLQSFDRRVRRQRGEPAQRRRPGGAVRAAARIWTRLDLNRAALKTVSFRVIVAAVDFSANYLVLGDLTVAAGLSTVSLVAGPIFYFLHETLWSWRGSVDTEGCSPGTVRIANFAVSRALGKTITYRVMATASEFTTNYVFVRDLATAALLSSFGFVLGPFVYYAHERAWERFGGTEEEVTGRAAPKRLPQPPPRLTYAGA